MPEVTKERHVIVVGAGPGGLTAAMILARRGYRVTVLEAHDTTGGRNAALRLGPYTFDVGPTFLMMPQVLDEVFEEAGTTTSARLDMKRLEPMYRLKFPDKHLDATTEPERMKSEIERCFPGRGAAYDAFVQSERRRFKALFPCLQKPYHRASSLLSKELLLAVPQLALGRSLFDVMRGIFEDDDLALAFTFQSKYLGMSPWACPGMFAMIPYVEHAFGVHHPIGGLSRISDVMADVAREHGAEIRLSTPVKRVVVERRRAVGVVLADGEEIRGDDVVLNADFGHAMTHLFEPGVLRKYVPERLAKMTLSCSTFMLYLGLDKTYDTPHHEIVFARDYRSNVDTIFEGGELSQEDFSFYVRNAGVTDPELAPPGHSALYVLVPVPNLRGVMDWEAARASMRERTLDAIASRTAMTDIRDHIVEERVVTPTDWRDEYAVFEGATFNLSHNWGQLIYFRPRNKFEELENCYLVGGGTHPGSGLPTIYESGRIAADLISTN